MTPDRQIRDRKWHAPDEGCLTTSRSGDIASMLRTVSASVSPLTTADVLAAMFSVSALRRFSAISNDVRVRVLASKNRFTTVFPRSAGTFLMGREAISCIATAVSRMRVISSTDSSAMPTRSFRLRRFAEIGGSAGRAAGVLFVALWVSAFIARPLRRSSR